MRTLAAALAALVLAGAGAASARDAGITAGVYEDELLVGYDPATGAVTGYFRAERDGPAGAAQFSCIFYLTGTLRGGAAAISTYFPEDGGGDLIQGELAVEHAGQVGIHLTAEHGGCWNVQHFADVDMPATFQLDAAHPWIAVAVIKAKTAHFYDRPEAAPRKSYVVRGDGVGVRAVRGEWLQVDFVGSGRTVTGWIRASDVYAPLP